MSLKTAARSLPRMELVPPREAKVEGVFRSDGSPYNGRIIYTENMIDIPATKASKKIKRDPVTGEEMWRKHPTTGAPTHPIYEMSVVFKERRYILHASEVGRHVKRVYNFEPTAQELAELERRKKEETFLQRFMRAAVERGVEPEMLAQELADDLGEDVEIKDLAGLDLNVEQPELADEGY